MKKTVWMLAGFFLLINFSHAKSFTDVKSSYWANSIIDKWTNNGIMSGYMDGSFKPNGYVTKAELVSIINNLNNDDEYVSKRPSKDIKITDWYCTDMAVALKNGIVELDSNGNLNPKELVTREEAITMIAKLFNLKYAGNSIGVLSRFSDGASAKSANMPYIAGMVNEGYVNGNGGKLNLKNKITRVEVLAILDNVVEEICSHGQISNKKINGNLIINGGNVRVSNVQVDGYIFALKGAKNGSIILNNVYATNGVNSKNNNIIVYNNGTNKNDNLSNIEEERHDSKVQFVQIKYSETDWTNESVTATLKFDDSDMKIINNNGKNTYKFKKNGEFTFVCVDGNGNEYRYTAKVNNIAKKDLEISVDVEDKKAEANVTVNILENEAPIKDIYYMPGKHSAKETLQSGEKVIDNKFTIIETDTYTVAVLDEAGNTVKKEFYWKNTADYIMTVKQNRGGTISPDTTILKRYENITFRITADVENGYYIEKVIVDGKEVDATVIKTQVVEGLTRTIIAEYSFNNIKDSHTIEVNYSLEKYAIDVIQPDVNVGKIVPDDTKVEFGSSQVFEIVPAEGYKITNVIVDDNPIGATNKYEFKNVRESGHTIKAEFEKKKYEIFFEPSENGRIINVATNKELSGKIEFEHGDDLTVRIESKEPSRFVLVDLVIDNVSIRDSLTPAYTFMNITEPHSIVAMFENNDALTTTQVGPHVYAAVDNDYNCIIYGFDETYDFTLNDTPLGAYTEQIKTIKIRSGITSIGDALFANCKNLESIELSDTIVDIGKYAFANCEKLESIILPNEMTTLEEGVFYNCKSLNRIIIPEFVTVIEADAFSGCSSMKFVTLPENLIEIKDRAFKNCSAWDDGVEIPEGTKTIGAEAFYGCQKIISLKIPKQVESIGKQAFSNCGKLQLITFTNRKDITNLGREWFPDKGDYKEKVKGNNYEIQRLSFEVLVGIPENGVITPATLNVQKLQDQQFEIIPNAGYEIDRVIVDGHNMGNNNTFTFERVESTHTIDAVFRPINYTISYNLANGNVAQENPTNYDVESTNITLNNPTKDFYDFAGWIEKIDGVTTPGVLLNVNIPTGSIGNREYIATWIAKSYTIAYIDPENAVNTNPESYTVETENITLTDLTKTGYTFNGWTDGVITTPTKGLQIPKGSIGDRTYTAHWTPIVYAITYNLNGGVFAEDTYPREYTIVNSSFSLHNPEKEGYVFTGWTGTGLTNKETSVVIPTGSYGHRTYDANWEVAEYTITCKLNGGVVDGSTADKEYKYTIQTLGFTLINPTRENYVFQGWQETTPGAPSELKLSVTINMGTIGHRTFTAHWIQRTTP